MRKSHEAEDAVYLVRPRRVASGSDSAELRLRSRSCDCRVLTREKTFFFVLSADAY